jgi:hypothetical protein
MVVVNDLKYWEYISRVRIKNNNKTIIKENGNKYIN